MRHFDREVIPLCVRWYLRYKLSQRDLVEMMAECELELAIRPSCVGSTVCAGVRKRAVEINMTSSMNPAVFGQKLILKASVTPGATGSITFTDGANTLGIVPLSGTGLAALTYSGLTAGAHTILATYSGDPNFF